MLHTQTRHYDKGTQRYITETTLHLDCGHKASYFGEPSDIDGQLTVIGVTIGATKVSRCKECSARYQALLKEVTSSGMIGRKHA